MQRQGGYPHDEGIAGATTTDKRARSRIECDTQGDHYNGDRDDPWRLGPWGIGDVVTAIEAVAGRTVDGFDSRSVSG